MIQTDQSNASYTENITEYGEFDWSAWFFSFRDVTSNLKLAVPIKSVCCHGVCCHGDIVTQLNLKLH